MRECLGWITNCQNDANCPQNWLEIAVSECPSILQCHVCGAQVEAVLTEDEFNAKASAQQISAWPVVPCTGSVGVPRAPTSAQPKNGQPHAPPPPAAAPIMVKSEWFVRLQNGEQVKLDKDTLIVGRSRTCDVVIPSAKVSRQHASLTRVEGDWHIEDLGSANGVWINGEKVTRIKISSGDTFTISDETLTFECR